MYIIFIGAIIILVGGFITGFAGKIIMAIGGFITGYGTLKQNQASSAKTNSIKITGEGAYEKIKGLEEQNKVLTAQLSKLTGGNTIPIIEAKIVHDEAASRVNPESYPGRDRPVFVLVFYIKNLGSYSMYDISLEYPKDRDKYRRRYERGNWVIDNIPTLDIQRTHELEMKIDHHHYISSVTVLPYTVLVKWRGGFQYTFSVYIDIIEKDFTKQHLPAPNYKITKQVYQYKDSTYGNINDMIKSISKDFRP